MKTIRIGSGAGYSGDRLEPAIELAEKGGIQYLCFECLAERTIALAQQAKTRDRTNGFDSLMAYRWKSILPIARRNGIRIITNMGAANTAEAVKQTIGIARHLGLKGLKVAGVYGDDVLQTIQGGDYRIMETGAEVKSIRDRLLSANAYLGAGPVVEALGLGADVVITGRISDPALFISPLVHEFGWSMDDWHRLGQATLVGHLLECGGQLCGGYFMEPGRKAVPAPARLGFPLAEVAADGSALFTKVSGSGGTISPATCTEQLLYELCDPSAYLTPDVVADFSHVTFRQDGPNRVRAAGATGRQRPGSLKVSLGYLDSFLGEGQISYAGPGAVERGRLALGIVRERLEIIGLRALEARYDLIGVDALHGPALGHEGAYEVRARVVVRTASIAEAVRVGNEVETLYTNGPAGGAGVSKQAREIVGMVSTLLPRELVTPNVVCEVA